MYQVMICPNYVCEMVALAGMVMVVRTLVVLLFGVAVCVSMVLRLRRNKDFYEKMGVKVQDELGLGVIEEVGAVEGHEVEVDEKGVSTFATIGRDIKLSDLNDVERSTDESDSSSQTSISLDYV